MGKRYFFGTTETTLAEAKGICSQERGSTLVEIRSLNQQRFLTQAIFDMMANRKVTFNHVWIGNGVSNTCNLFVSGIVVTGTNENGTAWSNGDDILFPANCSEEANLNVWKVNNRQRCLTFKNASFEVASFICQRDGGL